MQFWKNFKLLTHKNVKEKILSDILLLSSDAKEEKFDINECLQYCNLSRVFVDFFSLVDRCAF